MARVGEISICNVSALRDLLHKGIIETIESTFQNVCLEDHLQRQCPRRFTIQRHYIVLLKGTIERPFQSVCLEELLALTLEVLHL